MGGRGNIQVIKLRRQGDFFYRTFRFLVRQHLCFHRVTGRGRIGADGLAFWYTAAKGRI